MSDEQQHTWRRNPEHVQQRVYFVRCEATGLVKIGSTGNLWQRMKDLRGHSAPALTLLSAIDGYTKEERAWHAALADRRVHHEWFALEADDIPASAVDVGPYNAIAAKPDAS